ncbi:MAG: trypsin-like peptidase domain-containing protein [Flavobacteriales bacterium]
MRSYRILFALPVSLLFLFSGCASLLNSGKQSLQVESTPSGATVYENGAEVGTTPYTYTYDKPSGDKVSLELRKEGMDPVAFELRPTVKNSVMLVDALLLGIPYIVDGSSNKLYSFPVQGMRKNLYKAVAKDRQQFDLPVTVLENSLGSKAKVGVLGAHPLTVDSKELGDLRYPESATAAILRGMNNTNVSAHSVRLGTQKGDEDAQRAKLVLRPLLKKVDMQLTESDSRAYGNVHLEFDWRFYSGIDKDSVLFTISKATDWPVYGARPRDVFTDALQDAARQLLDEEGLYDRISAVYSSGLVRSKGENLKLATPSPIVFADRRSMIPSLVKGVVTVEVKDGHGSGFLITRDGYILTNAHVVGNEALVKVRFEQGFTLDGQVVKVNKDFDVALVKVAGNDLPALSTGDDEAVQLGEELFAIGTPLDEQLGQSVTRGIMSGRREIEGRKYLQTDVSINPGNSGGPLIDGDGKVVGIATMKVKATGVEGIGFGVPISTALEMLNIEFTK